MIAARTARCNPVGLPHTVQPAIPCFRRLSAGGALFASADSLQRAFGKVWVLKILRAPTPPFWKTLYAPGGRLVARSATPGRRSGETMSSFSTGNHAGPISAGAQPPVAEPTFAERVRTLVHSGRVGSLSTLSRKQQGFPFGSVMPYGWTPPGLPF